MPIEGYGTAARFGHQRVGGRLPRKTASRINWLTHAGRYLQASL
jgi:hypothetical protein